MPIKRHLGARPSPRTSCSIPHQNLYIVQLSAIGRRPMQAALQGDPPHHQCDHGDPQANWMERHLPAKNEDRHVIVRGLHCHHSFSHQSHHRIPKLAGRHLPSKNKDCNIIIRGLHCRHSQLLRNLTCRLPTPDSLSTNVSDCFRRDAIPKAVRREDCKV